LARRQAAEAVAQLAAQHPGLRCSIVEVAAAGDLQPDTPPAAMAGQGWFASALEQALVTGAADLAVHSAKDLPSGLASGLVVAAYPGFLWTLARDTTEVAAAAFLVGGLVAIFAGFLLATRYR
jgi:porphobilinogen deaminase